MSGPSRSGRAQPADWPTLSPRQAACLQRVARGETSSQIAVELGLSVRTIDQYVAEACLRLKARRRASAVATALHLGLIKL